MNQDDAGSRVSPTEKGRQFVQALAHAERMHDRITAELNRRRGCWPFTRNRRLAKTCVLDCVYSCAFISLIEEMEHAGFITEEQARLSCDDPAYFQTLITTMLSK